MRKIIPAFFLFIFLLSPCLSGQAYTPKYPDIRAKLTKSTRQMVVAVIDGDTLILQDQSHVRLVGIQAPEILHNAHKKQDSRHYLMGEPSKRALSNLVLNHFVTLYYSGQTSDRYGRTLAHLFLDNGVWVQGEMLKQGMAHVYSFPDNRTAVTDLIPYEQEARKIKAGIWAFDEYQPKDQSLAGKYTNSYQIITGIVKNVTKVKANYYLNFGEDWRKDFTVVVKSNLAKKFKAAKMPLNDFKGQTIEVRGWLKSYNGPMIKATHPEQIRIIKAK